MVFLEVERCKPFARLKLEILEIKSDANTIWQTWHKTDKTLNALRPRFEAPGRSREVG